MGSVSAGRLQGASRRRRRGRWRFYEELRFVVVVTEFYLGYILLLGLLMTKSILAQLDLFSPNLPKPDYLTLFLDYFYI
jgi:hypothetical protein